MSTSTTLDKKHWDLLSAMHCFGLLDNYESSFCVPEGWSVMAVGGPFIYFFLHLFSTGSRTLDFFSK